jgi:transglutaminase-like putative cysteine protease
MTAHGAAFPRQNYSQPNHVRTAPAVSHSTEYRPLADGDQGTFQTLDAMADAVMGLLGPDYSGYTDPTISNAAHQIAGSGQNSLDQIAALFDYASHKIRYVEHPFNTQVVQDAKRTMAIGSGDCVSLSVLLATLLASLGYKPRFVAQWVDGREASHVYVEVFVNGQWLALDAVASDKPMGWRQNTMDGGFELPWEIF